MFERVLVWLYRFHGAELDRSSEQLDAAAWGSPGDDAALQLLTAWRYEIIAQPLPAWAIDYQREASHNAEFDTAS